MKKAKPVRVKSNMTILKEKRRQIERDMAHATKKIDKFNELEAEMSALRNSYDELADDLANVKEAMRKELDL